MNDWPKHLGLVEWFQPGERERALQAFDDLQALGCSRLRTGFSWADYHQADGPAWYKWLFAELRARQIQTLPCFTYTPPSLGVEAKVTSPPRDPKAFADFIDEVITDHGDCFDEVELWNEPNNSADWDYRLDTNWATFSQMIGGAAYWAKKRGKRTILGGMSPFDPNWLALMGERGVLAHIDVVGVHGFPGIWDHEWSDWRQVAEECKRVAARYNPNVEIWITEGGYSTWRDDAWTQAQEFFRAADAPCERVYWYALHDLHPLRSHQGGGFHADERHYHFGLKRANGQPKLLFRMIADYGYENARKLLSDLTQTRTAPRRSKRIKPALITGGAGFIGTNVADAICKSGQPVRIFDNLSRPGVEWNLDWLCAQHGDLVEVEVGDVRDSFALQTQCKDIAQAFHFAAQVAVTTSLEDPVTDFDVNVRGTLNLLEALRTSGQVAPLLFTSTNKVYGDLQDLELVEGERRYGPAEGVGAIGEGRGLDFHSPYGASKGAADQYVLDYARSYRMPTTVFRMSCIYGPHQHGNEDQGWVAHFIKRALSGNPITLYGDGKQVRDILYVKDLVRAMMLAQEKSAKAPGRAYNIGGGIKNTVSLLECLDLVSRLLSEKVVVSHDDWRTGDQRYYVSDISKFTRATGWSPQVSAQQGLSLLVDWLRTKSKPQKVALVG